MRKTIIWFEMTQIRILFWMASGKTVHKILLLLAKIVYIWHTVIKTPNIWTVTVCKRDIWLFHQVLNALASRLKHVQHSIAPCRKLNWIFTTCSSKAPNQLGSKVLLSTTSGFSIGLIKATSHQTLPQGPSCPSRPPHVQYSSTLYVHPERRHNHQSNSGDEQPLPHRRIYFTRWWFFFFSLKY